MLKKLDKDNKEIDNLMSEYNNLDQEYDNIKTWEWTNALRIAQLHIEQDIYEILQNNTIQ